MTEDPRRDSRPAADPSMCLDDAAYVLGSLSPTERQAFEQHLASCPRCRASVARLAGLPGLLAVTSSSDIDVAPVPVPDSLLPRLLGAVARQRRRRLVLAGLAGAAVAAAVALVIALILWPSPTPPQALPAPVQMRSLVAAPLNVSLQLTDKQWGTSVVVHCAYDGPVEADGGYQLVAFDPAGTRQTLGWWGSVAGPTTTVDTASSLRLKDIRRLQVLLPDGTPILEADLPRK